MRDPFFGDPTGRLTHEGAAEAGGVKAAQRPQGLP